MPCSQAFPRSSSGRPDERMTNEEVVRSWYEARARGDFDEAVDLLASGVVWHIPGRSPIAGDHRGRDAVTSTFQTLRERTGGTFHTELLDLVVSPDTVVAIVHNTGRRGERMLDSRQALQFRVEQGQIAEIWIYVDDLYAVDAFWS